MFQLFSKHVDTRMEHSSSCNKAKWAVVWLLDIHLFAYFKYAGHSISQQLDYCYQHKPFLQIAYSQVSMVWINSSLKGTEPHGQLF